MNIKINLWKKLILSGRELIKSLSIFKKLLYNSVSMITSFNRFHRTLKINRRNKLIATDNYN